MLERDAASLLQSPSSRRRFFDEEDSKKMKDIMKVLAANQNTNNNCSSSNSSSTSSSTNTSPSSITNSDNNIKASAPTSFTIDNPKFHIQRQQHEEECNSNDSNIEDFSILLTTCLQNDFIGKLYPNYGTNYSTSLEYESSTFLHVGKPESQRLLGSDYKSGPLKRFMDWARRQSSQNLEIIHIRFWNDLDDAKCHLVHPHSQQAASSASGNGDEQIKYESPTALLKTGQLVCNGMFGIKGTKGAELVLNLDKNISKKDNESYVNINSLNCFYKTDLEEKIVNAIEKRKKEMLNSGNKKQLRVRIGIIGVWTESTIQFLFYELNTRYKHLVDHLSTCSALTASRSRHQHFTSLQQLERLLNVQILYSLCDFQEWLIPFWWKKTPSSSIVSSGRYFFKRLISPSSNNNHNNNHGDHGSSCNLTEDNSTEDDVEGESFYPIQNRIRIDWKSLGEDLHKLSDIDKEIICLLFHDSTDVVFSRLSGGHSGSWVFQVSSKDSMGHVQASSILKIGRRGPITRERVNFEKVEEILGNNAPQIRGFCELRDRAGIKFAYASMLEDDSQPSSFRELYVTGGTMTVIKSVLHRVFYGVLGKFYDAAVSEQIDLFETYDFDGKGWAWSTGGTDNPIAVKQRIVQIFNSLRDCSFFEPPKMQDATTTINGHVKQLQPKQPVKPGEEKYLIFPGGYRVKNIVHFLDISLPKIKTGYLAKSFHYVSYVHGDLNGRNIILDSNQNVWLIDFEYTERTHILKDVSRLENDVLYEYTVLDNEKELEEALLITRELMSVKDLAEPLRETIPGLKTDKLKRAWETVIELRNIVKKLVRGDRNPVQLDIVLLRYALHSTTLQSLNIYQRTWALASACGYAQRIERKAFRNDKYHIDWINLKTIDNKEEKGKLGISMLPGRLTHGGAMINDLKVLQKNKVTKLVVLATEEELERLNGDLMQEVTKFGIEARCLPILQRHPPPMNYALLLCEWICDAIDRLGENVVIVSMSGLGRSGTLASCVLLTRNPYHMDAVKAMDAVKLVRGNRVIENRRQASFVEEFQKVLLERLEKKGENYEQPHKCIIPLIPTNGYEGDYDYNVLYSPAPFSRQVDEDIFNESDKKASLLKKMKSYDCLLRFHDNNMNVESDEDDDRISLSNIKQQL
ncbi:hypothetical protein ABK040_001887 [Willaertia magna]